MLHFRAGTGTEDIFRSFPTAPAPFCVPIIAHILPFVNLCNRVFVSFEKIP